jgi:hypothetical protein
VPRSGEGDSEGVEVRVNQLINVALAQNADRQMVRRSHRGIRSETGATIPGQSRCGGERLRQGDAIKRTPDEAQTQVDSSVNTDPIVTVSKSSLVRMTLGRCSHWIEEEGVPKVDRSSPGDRSSGDSVGFPTSRPTVIDNIL